MTRRGPAPRAARVARAAVAAAALAAATAGTGCVHRPTPRVPPPAAKAPAPSDALPFAARLADVSDPALKERLAAMDRAGDRDGVFTRGDAHAAGDPRAGLFLDLHAHAFMSEALPLWKGLPHSTCGCPEAHEAPRPTDPPGCRCDLAHGPSDLTSTQLTFDMLLRGGTRVIVVPVYVGLFHPVNPMKAALEQLAFIRDYAAEHSDRMGIARSAAEARAIAAEGKIAVILAVEGGHMIERAEDVDVLWDAGVRLLTIAHFVDNGLAAAAVSDLEHLENFNLFSPRARRDGTMVNTLGLTALGRRVVRHMAARGMVIDVAHASDESIRDVLEATRDRPVPLVLSHTAARSLHPAERNAPDDLVRAIAARGGVAAVSAWRVQLIADGIEECRAVSAHVRHFLEIAGPAHVALGTDFNGGISRTRACDPPEPVGLGATGLRHAGDLPWLYQQLADDGVPPEVLEGFAENVLRVFETAERMAESPVSSP